VSLQETGALLRTFAKLRDTPEGRRRIAEEIAKLREWCQRNEVPWLPVAPPPTTDGPDHDG
jgi:hypothetical protein